jgi:hypothetical protein
LATVCQKVFDKGLHKGFSGKGGFQVKVCPSRALRQRQGVPDLKLEALNLLIQGLAVQSQELGCFPLTPFAYVEGFLDEFLFKHFRPAALLAQRHPP